MKSRANRRSPLQVESLEARLALSSVYGQHVANAAQEVGGIGHLTKEERGLQPDTPFGQSISTYVHDVNMNGPNNNP